MDAISVIKEDHRTVNELFKKFEKLGDRAAKSKRTTVDKIVRELSVHAAIEETVLYPFIRENIPEMKDAILEALEEHLVAKWELAALEDMEPKDERFDAKTTVLIESVRHHVREEEKEVLPQLRQNCSRAELQELGRALLEAKKTAPTHPHPRLPDEPPANAVTGAAGAVVDRARDLGKEAVERVRRSA
jgi:hemerythrin-like domain-containing protein